MGLDVNGIVGRTVQRVAGSAGFARVAPRVLPPADRLLNRVTGGRIVLSRALVPSLVLTTTGRRSGQPRATPLACLPDDDGSFLVVGSNFGREHHPAWTANLLEDPTATISYRARELPVRAHLLTESQTAEVWPRLTEMWPVFDRYVERSGRDLRVFRLVPA